MAMSRNARARKSKALAKHETRPLSGTAVNRRSSLTSTASATLSNRSIITNKGKQRAQSTSPQAQNNHDDELPVAEPITAQTNVQRSPEMPPYDFRAPVPSTAATTTAKSRSSSTKSRKSVQKASDNARVYPAPTHNRASPYRPTLQRGGAFPKERGNPPAGVGDVVWAKAFNCANSYIYNRMAISTRIGGARRAREEGLTRDLAVEGLIGKEVLRKGFVDASP